ncbi:MAG: hypothetical protein ABI442_13815 [Gemmatimonadaceae bacterium]
MTDLNRGLSEVPGLIAERKRYEAWVAALNERRDSTPSHVFARVEADYKTRLLRVAEQLASHRQAIEEERKNVVSRLSLLEAEERMRRDERAELDLRAHVGELEGEEALSAFGAVDEAIANLVSEKGGLQTRINELESLLEPAPVPSAQTASTETAGGEPRPGPVSTDPGDAAPLAVATTETSETAARESSSGPAVVDAHPIEASAAHHVGHAEAATGSVRGPRASAQLEIPATAEHAVVSKALPEKPALANAAPLAPPPSVESHRASDGMHTASGTFDELKFLDTLIGKDSGKPRGPRASEISPLKGVDGAAREPMGVPPLAANVPGNTPIVLRPSVAIDQSKTLKCSECGASNYPTEWYCERCGAELAAL